MPQSPIQPHRDHTPRRPALHHTLAIALTSVFTQPLLAETLSVCTDGGCDFSSIQAAIDAASDGDVIEIAEGTYLIDQTIDTLGRAVTILCNWGECSN